MKPFLHSLAALVITIPMAAQNAPIIRFTANVQPGTHSISARLPIEIKVENVGNAPVYIYGDLNYFITLFATTTEGKSLPDAFIAETLGPPPKRDSLVRLEPGHFLGLVWSEDLKALGIQKPGNYRLEFEYRSILSPEHAFGLPVWNGRQPLSIDVVVIP
jgi:hypothetical protein